MKMRHARLWRLVIALPALALTLAGCGGGGGGGGGVTASTASISGKVADGYISGATVYLYSDQAMTNQIGSGSTGATGNFSFTLTVSSVPSTIYIKSTGGTDIGTGLPAPTMFFAGSYTAGSLNVTPVTTMVAQNYLGGQSASPGAALSSVASSLGISTTDATADVVTNASAQAAMNQVLSTGMVGSTLSDGTYTVSLIYVEQSNLGVASAFNGMSTLNSGLKTWSNITVSNGIVSGTDGANTVSGVVKGSTILLSEVNPAGTNGLVMAGEMNYGSASGTLTRTTSGNQATGMFLATFTPSTITAAQTQNLFTALGNIFQGTHYFAAATCVPGSLPGSLNLSQYPFVSFGQIAITPSTLTSSGFQYTGFTDTGLTGSSNATTQLWSTAAGNASFLTGSRIYAFSQTYNSNYTLWVVGAVGNRNCVGLVVDGSSGTITQIQRITLVKQTNIAPVFQSNTTYYRYEATSNPSFIGLSRTTYVPTSAAMKSKSDCAGNCFVFAHGTIQTPTFTSGINSGFPANNPDSNVVLAGSSILQEKISSWSATSLGSNDSIQAVNLYQSGAMSGTQTFGSNPGLPATNVFYMRQDGSTPPDFNGVINFISRGLYTTDYSSVQNYLSEAYAYGTLTLNTATGNAVFAYTNGSGGSGTVAMTLTKLTDPTLGVFSGMVWFNGALPTGGYIDIFWPIGGKMATYVVSSSNSGTIREVGEAYLTY